MLCVLVLHLVAAAYLHLAIILPSAFSILQVITTIPTARGFVDHTTLEPALVVLVLDLYSPEDPVALHRPTLEAHAVLQVLCYVDPEQIALNVVIAHVVLADHVVLVVVDFVAHAVVVHVRHVVDLVTTLTPPVGFQELVRLVVHAALTASVMDLPVLALTSPAFRFKYLVPSDPAVPVVHHCLILLTSALDSVYFQLISKRILIHLNPQHQLVPMSCPIMFSPLWKIIPRRALKMLE